MDCSTPGFPVLHYHPEFAQTHIHWIGDAIKLSHPLSPHSSPALSLSQYQLPIANNRIGLAMLASGKGGGAGWRSGQGPPLVLSLGQTGNSRAVVFPRHAQFGQALIRAPRSWQEVSKQHHASVLWFTWKKFFFNFKYPEKCSNLAEHLLIYIPLDSLPFWSMVDTCLNNWEVLKIKIKITILLSLEILKQCGLPGTETDTEPA